MQDKRYCPTWEEIIEQAINDVGRDGAALQDEICAQIVRTVLRRNWHVCLVEELGVIVLDQLNVSPRFLQPHPMDEDYEGWLVEDSVAHQELLTSVEPEAVDTK